MYSYVLIIYEYNAYEYMANTFYEYEYKYEYFTKMYSST